MFRVTWVWLPRLYKWDHSREVIAQALAPRPWPGFRLWSLGFRVCGLGFRVEGFRVVVVC